MKTRKKGWKLSEEAKEKIRQSKLGDKNPMWGKGGNSGSFKNGDKAWNKGLKGIWSNENHFAWKGDNASYRAKHIWVETRLGKASFCAMNLSHISTRYHWANISHTYKRDLEDWICLCPKCHKQYDMGRIQL